MLNESFGVTHVELQSEVQTKQIDWQDLPMFLTNNREDIVKGAPAENFHRDSLHLIIPMSIIYMTILLTGVTGNISTCIVIARNKSMHTATNYYLFSLAISDLLLLISGLPPEMYYIWSKYPYIFGEAFCIIQSFAAETSANATVLTITAFTIERYVAICHPFLSHTICKLSRAIKYVVVIWLLALCLAVPQAIQFGIVFQRQPNGTIIKSSATCSIKWIFINHAFEISTVVLFVLPMTIITVLYVLIGIKLRNSRLLTVIKRKKSTGLTNMDITRNKCNAQRNVIHMLVAVVVAFFICWAPFHAQRLLAVYAESNKKDERKTAILLPVYTTITYVSGIFYYLSTTINPILYNIMSYKFREAFKTMFSKQCGRGLQKVRLCHPTYSIYPHSTAQPADPQITASLSSSEEMQKLKFLSNKEYDKKICKSLQECNKVYCAATDINDVDKELNHELLDEKPLKNNCMKLVILQSRDC